MQHHASGRLAFGVALHFHPPIDALEIALFDRLRASAATRRGLTGIDDTIHRVRAHPRRAATKKPAVDLMQTIVIQTISIY